MAAMMTACQDDWDEHYNQQPDSDYGTSSIYEVIASKPELSDFKAVLDSARLFANSRITGTHYSEFVGSDQFLTVWAPVNGTFNKDSLLQLMSTSRGDSLVEHTFLKNHIANFNYSDNGKEQSFFALNGKRQSLKDGYYSGSRIKNKNISLRNGVLNIIERPAEYRYSIFEALENFERYDHIGKYYRSYDYDRFDESSSLPIGVVDGKTVYIDSVFYAVNPLLGYYERLIDDDSTFLMLMPNRQIWDSVYAEAETYFNFGNVNKSDSLHKFYSHNALLGDLIYNPTSFYNRSPKDSLCATNYRAYTEGNYHVLYNPFEQGSPFTSSKETYDCSNGTIYSIDYWPFKKETSYFTQLKVEGESRTYLFDNYESSTKKLKLDYRETLNGSVSGYRYISITPQTLYDSYYVVYEVPSVLSGTYDVCVVMLPKTIYNPNYDPEEDKKQFRPNKFTAEITYGGLDGQEYTIDTKSRYIFDETTPQYYVKSTAAEADYVFDCDFTPTTATTRAFTNDPLRIDTIKLATVHFPTCNLAQPKTTTRVKIQNNVSNKQTNTYNSEMFIDCIIFRPHVEE